MRLRYTGRGSVGGEAERYGLEIYRGEDERYG